MSIRILITLVVLALFLRTAESWCPSLKIDIGDNIDFISSRAKRSPSFCSVARGLKSGDLNVVRPRNAGPLSYAITNPAHNGRVELVRAVILPQHLGTGTPVSPAARRYAVLMGNPGDHAGHVIGRYLGGPGNIVYNIFPQHPRANRQYWDKFEKKIADFLKSGNGNVAKVMYAFDYGNNEATTRPIRFAAVADLVDGNGKIDTFSIYLPNSA